MTPAGRSESLFGSTVNDVLLPATPREGYFGNSLPLTVLTPSFGTLMIT
jgi:hypothetical protein